MEGRERRERRLTRALSLPTASLVPPPCQSSSSCSQQALALDVFALLYVGTGLAIAGMMSLGQYGRGYVLCCRAAQRTRAS